jgi:hypothetical protein
VAFFPHCARLSSKWHYSTISSGFLRLPPFKSFGYMPSLRRGIFPIIARILIREEWSPWLPQKCT